jgi:hypothetical protein
LLNCENLDIGIISAFLDFLFQLNMQRISIHTATEEQLQQLHGVGPYRARAIVNLRQQQRLTLDLVSMVTKTNPKMWMRLVEEGQLLFEEGDPEDDGQGEAAQRFPNQEGLFGFAGENLWPNAAREQRPWSPSVKDMQPFSLFMPQVGQFQPSSPRIPDMPSGDVFEAQATAVRPGSSDRRLASSDPLVDTDVANNVISYFQSLMNTVQDKLHAVQRDLQNRTADTPVQALQEEERKIQLTLARLAKQCDFWEEPEEMNDMDRDREPDREFWTYTHESERYINEMYHLHVTGNSETAARSAVVQPSEMLHNVSDCHMSEIISGPSEETRVKTVAMDKDPGKPPDGPRQRSGKRPVASTPMVEKPAGPMPTRPEDIALMMSNHPSDGIFHRKGPDLSRSDQEQVRHVGFQTLPQRRRDRNIVPDSYREGPSRTSDVPSLSEDEPFQHLPPYPPDPYQHVYHREGRLPGSDLQQPLHTAYPENPPSLPPRRRVVPEDARNPYRPVPEAAPQPKEKLNSAVQGNVGRRPGRNEDYRHPPAQRDAMDLMPGNAQRAADTPAVSQLYPMSFSNTFPFQRNYDPVPQHSMPVLPTGGRDVSYSQGAAVQPPVRTPGMSHYLPDDRFNYQVNRTPQVQTIPQVSAVPQYSYYAPQAVYPPASVHSNAVQSHVTNSDAPIRGSQKSDSVKPVEQEVSAKPRRTASIKASKIKMSKSAVLSDSISSDDDSDSSDTDSSDSSSDSSSEDS